MVAGPWYARNAPAAVKLGAFSARYNLIAEGQSHIVPIWDRLCGFLQTCRAGLCLYADARNLGVSISVDSVPVRDPRNSCSCSPPARSPSGHWEHDRGGRRAHDPGLFRHPLSAASLAVDCGRSGRWARTQAFRGLTFRPRLPSDRLRRHAWPHRRRGRWASPHRDTCWAARGLIDQIVSRYGVATLANVGNIADWNVCKTGLINELRDNPGDCFVLHDLSAESAEGFAAASSV